MTPQRTDSRGNTTTPGPAWPGRAQISMTDTAGNETVTQCDACDLAAVVTDALKYGVRQIRRREPENAAEWGGDAAPAPGLTRPTAW